MNNKKRLFSLTHFIEHHLSVVQNGEGLFFGVRHTRQELLVALAVHLHWVVAMSV